MRNRGEPDLESNQTFAESAPVTEEADSKPAPEVIETAAADVPSEAPQPETVPTTPFDAPVSAQTPDVAPETAPATQKATRKQKAPKAAETGPREGSKTSRVIAMLKREGGATLEEIMTAMGWLKHTTRAMLSAGAPSLRTTGSTIISEKVGRTPPVPIKASTCSSSSLLRRSIRFRRLFSLCQQNPQLCRPVR